MPIKGQKLENLTGDVYKLQSCPIVFYALSDIEFSFY